MQEGPKLAYFTVELPVDGGKPFHWTVDGRPINLRAPEGKKKGDVVTCRTGSNARMSTRYAWLFALS